MDHVRIVRVSYQRGYIGEKTERNIAQRVVRIEIVLRREVLTGSTKKVVDMS